MADKYDELIEALWASDAASQLTNQAARAIEELRKPPAAVWVSEFTVPTDDRDGTGGVKFEDGGQAAIMYYEVDSDTVRPRVGDDGCFFVRLHSWDEREVTAEQAATFAPQHYFVMNKPANVREPYKVPKRGVHPLFRSLMGKKVRVTIETIEE